MGPLGAQEMFFIALLALLLFGPKKLPELGRMLGKGLTEFRRAKNELKSTFESHMQELEREARISEQAESAKRDQNSGVSYSSPSNSSSSYSYPYDEFGRQDNGEPNGTSPHESLAPAPTGIVPHSRPSQPPSSDTAVESAAHAIPEENRPA